MSTTETTQIPRITLPCSNCGKWNRVRVDRSMDGPKCGMCGTGLALRRPVQLDDDCFDRVIADAGIPVLVDFYADWCGPCKVMAPAVEALAAESLGRALVAKLDTDRAQQTAARFQIRGIPTTIVFSGGVEVTRRSGAVPLGVLRAMIPVGP